MTEDKKNLNFSMWVKKLKDYDCFSESLIDELGDKLTNAPFSTNEKSGGAYDGGLIDIILSSLCTIGYHINENCFGLNQKGRLNHQFLSVNSNMLMRVLLLQHISKAQMFVEQSESWKKNKGFLYDFDKNDNSQLKLGERSAFLCMKHGIKLSQEEFEAMVSIDNEDKNTNPYMNPLVLVVRIVNQLTTVEIQRKYDYYNQ